jgi:dolichol-phosphate mannosyltransferase
VIRVVIPAYNEALNIDRLLDSLGAALPELGPHTVLIVDDGSTDGTADLIRERAGQIPIEVLSHSTNRGVHEAFRSGFTRVLEEGNDDDIVLTMEADNTSDPGILRAMLDQMQQGSDLVLASCYAPGGGVRGTTWWRIFLSRAANLLLRLAFRLGGIHTYSSFYRMYRLGLLRRAAEVYGAQLMDQAGFVCVVELLIRLHRLPGVRIGEVPMVLECAARNGPSKMRVWRTALRYLPLLAAEATWRPLRWLRPGSTAARESVAGRDTLSKAVR